MAYTPEEIKEAFDSAIKSIEQGESLRNALSGSDTPSRTTFFKWIDDDEEKLNQYTRACEARADLIFEDILEIADENNADVYVDDLGVAKIDGNSVNRSRLKVDARKWMLSKMQPKKYGEKLDLTSKGDKIETTQIIGMVIKDEQQADD
jgi:hypothetical protein